MFQQFQQMARNNDHSQSTSTHRGGRLSPEDRGDSTRSTISRVVDSVVMDLVQNTVMGAVLRSQGLEAQSIQLHESFLSLS